MARRVLSAVLIVSGVILFSACSGGQSGGVTPSVPPAAENPEATALPTALPTAQMVVATQTTVPEPTPTAAQAPSLPADLETLTYRTFEGLKELSTLPYDGVIDLAYSPDHRYLRIRQALSEDTHNDIFLDLETGEESFSLEGGQRVYFGPESKSIAALDGNSLTVYDLESGETKLQYNSRYQIAALSPDGRTIIEIEDVEEGTGTTFRAVDLTSEEEKYRIFINGELKNSSLQFDEDEKLMAASSFASPNTYITTIWDFRTGRVRYSTYGYSEVALHPFGSEIAISSAKQSYISLISTVTWQQKLYLGPAENGPSYYSVEYSGGGRLIYALIDDEEGNSTVQFWYPPSGEELPFAADQNLLAVAVSPDNKLLAASYQDGTVVVWGVPE
jgi:WD40 repeat protein